MVDLMRLFAGEFADIHSFVSNSFWHHDVEDNAYALMRTAGGVVAMLHSSATQWRHRFQLGDNAGQRDDRPVRHFVRLEKLRGGDDPGGLRRQG